MAQAAPSATSSSRPALGLAHVVIYVAHRASVGTVPAKVPAEFYSPALASATLIFLLYQLVAPVWLLVVDLAVTFASLAAALGRCS